MKYVSYCILCLIALGIKGTVTVNLYGESVYFIYMSPFWVVIPFISLVLVMLKIKNIPATYFIFSSIQTVLIYLEFTSEKIYDGLSDYDLFAYSSGYLVLYLVISLLLNKAEKSGGDSKVIGSILKILEGKSSEEEIKEIVKAIQEEDRHDVNNLLCVLVCRAEITKKFAEFGQTDKIIEQCDKIISLSEQYSKSKKVKNKDILEILEKVERYGVDLKVNKVGGLTFTGDETILTDILINIFKNAKEANAKEVHIDIKDTEMLIKDDGDPIPEEVLSGEILSTKSNSRGKGLSSMKRKVKELKGVLLIQPCEKYKLSLAF